MINNTNSIQEKKMIEYFKREVFNLIDKNLNVYYWLAGGSLTNYILGIPINDFDIYFNNRETLLKVLDYIIKNGGKINLETNNAYNINFKGKDFDLIKILFESPEQTIQAFDINVVCIALDSNLKMLYNDNFFEDMAYRQINIVKNDTYILSLKRLLKYTLKGFKIDDNTLNEYYLKLKNSYYNKPMYKKDENVTDEEYNKEEYEELNRREL